MRKHGAFLFYCDTKNITYFLFKIEKYNQLGYNSNKILKKERDL